MAEIVEQLQEREAAQVQIFLAVKFKCSVTSKAVVQQRSLFIFARPVVRCPVCLMGYQKSLPVLTDLELATGLNLDAGQGPKRGERPPGGPGLLLLKAVQQSPSHQRTLHTTRASFSASWTLRV